MSEVYVTIITSGTKRFVQVQTGGNFAKKQQFLLTVAGCKKAGCFIFSTGAEDWLNSSSVDHQKLDVRELMGEGFRLALEEAQAPRKAMIAKILAHCERKEFQTTLTKQEQAIFQEIAADYK